MKADKIQIKALEELKGDYKELGRLRSNFVNKVTTTFLNLYDDLIEYCGEDLVDIIISSSSTSKWIDITTTLYNYDVALDQEMQHTPHISFNLKEIDIKDVNLTSIQKSCLINFHKLLYNYYFYLPLKNKNVDRLSIDKIYEELKEN